MPLYEVASDGLHARPTADFAALSMYERNDLQRLLRDEISALGEDLLVISEEFGNWEDARRRIDLLALDKSGRLVVIEIKRTDDGGHMELQAIRYAAMVSSMGFTEVLDAYTAHRARLAPQEETDARAELETFLEHTEDGEEPVISTDVRLILVSADFGREITTAVLWLNGFEGMDIRCVRLVPYELEDKILLDIQQVIPLPEAADYQVRLRKKGAARERAQRSGRDLSRFHIVVDGEELPDENKRNAVRVMLQQLVRHGVAPMAFAEVLPKGKLRIVEGVHRDESSLTEAAVAADPRIDLRRWFFEHPLVDESVGKTVLLSKMWGSATEQRLATLATAFPDAKVSYRKAGTST